MWSSAAGRRLESSGPRVLGLCVLWRGESIRASPSSLRPARASRKACTRSTSDTQVPYAAREDAHASDRRPSCCRSSGGSGHCWAPMLSHLNKCRPRHAPRRPRYSQRVRLRPDRGHPSAPRRTTQEGRPTTRRPAAARRASPSPSSSTCGHAIGHAAIDRRRQLEDHAGTGGGGQPALPAPYVARSSRKSRGSRETTGMAAPEVASSLPGPRTIFLVLGIAAGGAHPSSAARLARPGPRS